MLVVSEEGFVSRGHLRSMVYLKDDKDFTQVEILSVKEKGNVGKAM